MKKEVSIVGLGKLGLCLSACFASSGFKVIGIDNDKKVIDALSAGKPLIEEPGLLPLLKRHHAQLGFSCDYTKAIQETDITLLVLPTPSLKNGEFDLQYLKASLISLAGILKSKPKHYHTFVIVSTVSPCSIDGELIPLIEKYSRRKLNLNFGFCYNPAFVALGSCIRDFKEPDLDLIGQSNEKTGAILENIKKDLYKKPPYFARMSITSAEITKISLNSYITMKISFINNLSDICRKIPHANIDHVAKALGQDKRISPFYLNAGLGFGGPCFPRDNKAFGAFAKKYKILPVLAQAVDKINNDHTSIIIQDIFDNLPVNCDTVSVIGLSYKPHTSVIEGSTAIAIIKACLAKKLKVIVYDPQAMPNTYALFGRRITYAASFETCLKASHCWIIASNAPEYNLINKKTFTKPITIIDCWGSMTLPLPSKVKYIVPINPNKNRK